MAVLPILKYPDPRLRIKAKKVETIEALLLQQVENMYETMYHEKGMGLAATQVDIHCQIFVMDVSEKRDQKVCILNPVIVSQEGEQYEEEGCLSIREAFDKVKRAAKLTMRGQGLDNQPIEIQAEGLLAICIQHEIDHLNGILFIDHLSRLKQERITKKLQKREMRESSDRSA